MSKVLTWDKSKENKKQRKRPDGSGSSKLHESFNRPSLDKLRIRRKKKGAKKQCLVI